MAGTAALLETTALRKGRRTYDCGRFSLYGRQQPPCRGRGDVARTVPVAGSRRNDGSDSVEALSGRNEARSSADNVTGKTTTAAAWVRARRRPPPTVAHRYRVTEQCSLPQLYTQTQSTHRTVTE